MNQAVLRKLLVPTDASRKQRITRQGQVQYREQTRYMQKHAGTTSPGCYSLQGAHLPKVHAK